MAIHESGDFSKTEYWNDRWQKQDSPWHKKYISNSLLEFFHPTISKLAKPIRVLIPLCGKSLDIKWIGNEGIEVIGLEGCQETIEEFFKENKFTFQMSKYEDSLLYKCDSLPISIYQCDIFNVDIAKFGKFNVVFDQGCLVAIDPKDRIRYINLIKALLAENFQYLLDSIVHGPPTALIGPPHNLTFKEVQNLYSDFNCEILKEQVALQAGKKLSDKFEYFNFIAIKISPNHLALTDISTLYYWDKRFGNKDTPWHKNEVNRTLIENFKRMVDNLKAPVHALVPLCGKSHDLKWISEQGIAVTGVEGSKTSIDEFFSEHSLSFNVVEIKNGILKYTCHSLPLTIYNCNFFRINEFLNEKFNFIWDRGSLVAIEPSERIRYAQVISCVLADEFEYLLEAIVHGPEGAHKGPPNNTPHQEVLKIFGEKYNCEILITKDVLEYGKKLCDKFEYFYYNTTRISPKI